MFLEGMSHVQIKMNKKPDDSEFHSNGYVAYHPALEKYLDLTIYNKTFDWYHGTTVFFDGFHLDSLNSFIVSGPTMSRINEYDRFMDLKNLLTLDFNNSVMFVPCKIYIGIDPSVLKLGVSFIPDFRKTFKI
jgi:hypothetical protein